MSFPDTSDYPVVEVTEETIVRIEVSDVLVDPRDRSQGTFIEVWTAGKPGALRLKPSFFAEHGVDPSDAIGLRLKLNWKQHPSGEGAKFGTVVSVL